MLSIQIKGRNLHEMVDLLREERITNIQERIAEWHDKPTADQPFIEVMQITEPGRRSKGTPKKH